MIRRLLVISCCALGCRLPLSAQNAAPSPTGQEPPPRALRAEIVPEDEEEPVAGPTDPDMAEEEVAAIPEDAPETAEEKRRRLEEFEDDEPLEVKAVPADEAEPLTVRAVPGTSVPKPAPPVQKPEKPKIAISLNTDPNARPLSLRVPAPRGQIVDRRGEPLAQNRIAYYLGVQLPLQDGLSDAAIYNAARQPVAWVRRTLPGGWELKDDKILEHYHKRRWVPLLSSSMVPDEVVEKIRDHLPGGVVLRPFYLRTYPKETMASHVLGYMGKSGSMAAGDIVTDEYLWPPTVGKYGLEENLDADLTGNPGTYSVLYNAAGEKLSEDWVSRPTAGHTVVTSLDSRFQGIVEREMQEKAVRGAFVIMDVKTGDVIAMCSNPGYNPNDWVYGISEDDYKKLFLDKQNPLLPRALQGQYPPASTFKIVTALAALDSGKVSENTYFNCPKGMMFGRTWMWNHSQKDEGSMNVVQAIKRSCNPWFWQAARMAGAANVSAMAVKLGYGSKTGILLSNMEASGNMPTPEFYEKRGGAMRGGVLANIAIGQGEVLATPLQVCQMMAGVARGDAVPRPRLVRQIQDVNGRIVRNFPPTFRTSLDVDKDALKAVRQGMQAVVNDGGGTGTRASNRYVTLCGKTGTGEWHDSPKDYVAWFAGFVPAKNPEYAYAALYEGDPGDRISGGGVVAPIVGAVFNKIYKIKRDGDEMPEDKASGDSEEGDEPEVSTNRRKKSGSAEAKPQAPPVAVPVPQEAPRAGLRGWWKRLRGGG